jgi:hypothetical protein
MIAINAPIAVRDGRKMRLFYHAECFSESSDPRTQQNSSFKKEKFKDSFQDQAPLQKGRGKWSVSNYGYVPSIKSIKPTIIKPKMH